MTVRSQAAGGFGMVPRWVFMHPDVRASRWASDVYTYLAIVADRTEAGDVANRFRSTLAEELSCSVDTIDRATAILERIGALTVHRRRAPNGDNLANEYVVNMVPVVPDEDPGRTPAARGHASGEGAAAQRRGGRTGAARGPHPSGPLQEPLIQEPSDQEPLGPAPAGRAAKRRTNVEGVVLTEPMRTAASNAGLPAPQHETEFAKFVDHHRAKGSTFQDWTAAWRNWARRAVEFSARSRPKGVAPAAGALGRYEADNERIKAEIKARRARERAEAAGEVIEVQLTEDDKGRLWLR